MKQATFIFFFFSIISIYLKGMESGKNNDFTVSPAVLTLDNKTCYDLRSDSNFNSITQNGCPFYWKGSLSKSSINELKNATFHFENFDLKKGPKDFECTISFKNNTQFDPEAIVQIDAEAVVQTLKNYKLINQEIYYWNLWFKALNKKNRQNNILPFQIFDAMLFFPFVIKPLFPQEIYHYVSRFASPFQKTLNLNQINLNFDSYIRSTYRYERSPKETILFIELINTCYKETINGMEDPFSDYTCQDHQIKIYRLYKNKKKQKVCEIMQTIILPRTATDNIRFNIETIFKGVLVLHDMQYNEYPCFALPDNKYITY